MKFVGQLINERGIRIRTQKIVDRLLMRPRSSKSHNRVGQNREVRTAGHTIHRIGRIGIIVREMRDDRGGEVSARGKADDADPVRPDAELRGVIAHVSNGSLGVEERGWIAVARSKPIFHHEAGHAEGIQPSRDVVAFVRRLQHAVRASRTNHHARIARVPSCRKENRNRGRIRIPSPQAPGRIAGPQPYHGRGGNATSNQVNAKQCGGGGEDDDCNYKEGSSEDCHSRSAGPSPPHSRTEDPELRDYQWYRTLRQSRIFLHESGVFGPFGNLFGVSFSPAWVASSFTPHRSPFFVAPASRRLF